jgi:periplasmic protein CpxP/Spy
MTTASDNSPQPASRRRWFAGLAVVGGVTLLGTAAQAHGWGRRHRLDPQEMAHRLQWRIGRLVQEAGGTPQQKDRIVAIASAALTDLRPLREQRRQARRHGLELLSAPVVDRGALEQLRVAQLQLADTTSRRTLQAFADAAEVLTPEQRAKVAEHLKHRMDRHRAG